MNIVTSFFIVRKLQQAISLAVSSSEIPSLQSSEVMQSAASSETVASMMASLPPPIARRQEEYIDCVVRNAGNSCVRRILLLTQDRLSHTLLSSLVLPRLGTVHRHKVLPMMYVNAPAQPTYTDLFAASKMLLDDDTPCMVCNSDIYVPPDFNLTRVSELVGDKSRSTVLALTRYEHSEAGEVAPLITDYRGSHDAFIFRPAQLTRAFLDAVNHPQNCYKSENIVIHEFQRAGVEVRNPCYSIKIFHRHEADVRQWLPPVDESRYGRAYPEQ